MRYKYIIWPVWKDIFKAITISGNGRTSPFPDRSYIKRGLFLSSRKKRFRIFTMFQILKFVAILKNFNPTIFPKFVSAQAQAFILNNPDHVAVQIVL